METHKNLLYGSAKLIWRVHMGLFEALIGGLSDLFGAGSAGAASSIIASNPQLVSPNVGTGLQSLFMNVPEQQGSLWHDIGDQAQGLLSNFQTVGPGKPAPGSPYAPPMPGMSPIWGAQSAPSQKQFLPGPAPVNPIMARYAMQARRGY